jgi:hypothetical protein
MFGSARRTALVAILVPIAAGCAGAPLNPVPGAAPYERELSRVAEATLTAASARHHVGVIAHDSMGGRNTPSPGLEKTAEYFASKYREWGVQPGGDNGSYIQRYPFVKRAVDGSQSWVEINENGTVSRYPMDKWAYGIIPVDAHVSGPVVLLAGDLTPEAIQNANLRGKIAVLVVDPNKVVEWNRWRAVIAAQGPAATVTLTNQPVEQFRMLMQRTTNPTGWSLGLPETRPQAIVIHDSLFAGDPASANRPNFDEMRRATTAVVMEAPEEIQFTIHTRVREFDRITVPNVIGIIPGSDPVLRNEYVIFSAHMDHVGTAGDGVGGCRAMPATETAPADSICNGADDDASGSTGILMVAEAFSKLKVKPRRSIVILHVSGEEKGLLGSRWYSENPTVPLAQTIANVNFDMIGRNNADSIVVIGKEHSDMGQTLARVMARHPELRFTTADDIWPEERFYFRSDHFNFARKGVPVLFFFNGVHEDYHRPSDHVEKIDADKIARVAKTGFYLAAELANTPARPQWNPESYKEIVEQ